MLMLMPQHHASAITQPFPENFGITTGKWRFTMLVGRSAGMLSGASERFATTWTMTTAGLRIATERDASHALGAALTTLK
jgi:hypothetical protein